MAFPSAAFFPLLLFFHPSFTLSFPSPANEGFSVELIHRDSPRSPFYNPADTPYDRLRAAVHRSRVRADYFHRALSLQASKGTFQSPVIPNTNSYLMTINVGTPPSKILAIVDTGSDISWTNCKPCSTCYKQKAPLFDPNNSSTYHDFSCKSVTCSKSDNHGCSEDGSKCTYQVHYGDGSHTIGYLASETFTFDTKGGRSSTKIPNLAFGCSHDSQGTFDSHGAGIVGLGGGSLSLVSQLGSFIDRKFSYCLVPYSQGSSSTSLLTLGANAVASNPHAVSTPLVRNQYGSTFYTVVLEALGVGDDKLFPFRGNVIVDSGTTLTFLWPKAVKQLTTRLLGMVPYRRVKDVDGFFDLCYDIRGHSDADFPDITFRFTGATVKLSKLNTFRKVREGVACLAIVSVNDHQTMILGNIAQQNFHLGYDLVEKKLHFAPADCIQL